MDNRFLSWFGVVLAFTLTMGCSSMGGKVETSFTETIEDEEGAATTGYRATSKAGMFGTLDTSSHEFKYDWDGNSIMSGQDALGQDNTGNQAVVTMLGEVISAVIQKLIDMQIQQLALRQSYLDNVEKDNPPVLLDDPSWQRLQIRPPSNEP